MSAILLFCTANVPAQVWEPLISMDAQSKLLNFWTFKVINRLMEECAIPEDADNIFSLVRTPDQESLDEWKTEPPVHDFSTGFEAAFDWELRSQIGHLIQRSTGGASTSLAGDWMAVLDDKSEAQFAVVLHYSYPQDLWDEPIVGPAEISEGTIWWKWRVPFKAAWTVFNAVGSCGYDGIELYSRDEYRDTEGVLQTEIPDMILAGEMEDPKES